MFIYVIKSEIDNYIYVGTTINTERRIKEHNSGRNKTTKSYKPFKILLIEEYPDRATARQREIYLKSGCGKEWIKSIYCRDGGTGRPAYRQAGAQRLK
ncbi:MAG: GIY-YIG nuclease family protein [Patescibacteria group bacterium]